MTLPIGSGFYSSSIPTKRIAKQLPGDALASAPQKVNPDVSKDYVKSSASGLELAKQLNLHSSSVTYQNTIYDQPSMQVSRAISTYNEFANLEQRAHVQSLIGVDIYA